MFPSPCPLQNPDSQVLKQQVFKLEEVYMTRSWDAVLSQYFWAGVLETAFPASSLAILMVEI